MNIVRENLEDGTTLLKATVAEADYNEAVDKALRTYKRKANVPGFRPGMVPDGHHQQDVPQGRRGRRGLPRRFERPASTISRKRS